MPMTPSEHPGQNKLTEECGELVCELGKLAAYPSGEHPDGKGNLIDRVRDESADVVAAALFFSQVNFSEDQKQEFHSRIARKLDTFRRWHATGE